MGANVIKSPTATTQAETLDSRRFEKDGETALLALRRLNVSLSQREVMIPSFPINT